MDVTAPSPQSPFLGEARSDERYTKNDSGVLGGMPESEHPLTTHSVLRCRIATVAIGDLAKTYIIIAARRLRGAMVGMLTKYPDDARGNETVEDISLRPGIPVRLSLRFRSVLAVSHETCAASGRHKCRFLKIEPTHSSEEIRMPLSWDVFAVILVTAGTVGMFTALCCVALLAHNMRKYHWNGHILVTTDTQPEWSWQNAGPPPRHMTMILPTESRLTAVRLCGARAGNLPFIRVRQRDKKSRLLYEVGFFLRPSHNHKDTDIVLLTPVRGEDVRIEIHDELDKEGYLEPAREFDIEWRAVSVLA